jgi:hypothetical protein
MVAAPTAMPCTNPESFTTADAAAPLLHLTVPGAVTVLPLRSSAFASMRTMPPTLMVSAMTLTVRRVGTCTTMTGNEN